MKHSNLKSNQLELNINKLEFTLVESLTTREVSQLIHIVVKKRISSKQILDRARNGKLEISHTYGVLIIFPSCQGKSGRFWRWDVLSSPKILTHLSA